MESLSTLKIWGMDKPRGNWHFDKKMSNSPQPGHSPGTASHVKFPIYSRILSCQILVGCPSPSPGALTCDPMVLYKNLNYTLCRWYILHIYTVNGQRIEGTLKLYLLTNASSPWRLSSINSSSNIPVKDHFALMSYKQKMFLPKSPSVQL